MEALIQEARRIRRIRRTEEAGRSVLVRVPSRATESGTRRNKVPLDPDLPPDARRKLAGVLGMLGSDHAGERDAAAQLASKIVRAAGMTWDQVIAVPRLESQYQPHSPREAPPRPPPGWRALANRCAAYPAGLTDWEASFLVGLFRWAELSTKQHACLNRIAEQVA